MIEHVTRKELLNVLKMMDKDIEKEIVECKEDKIPYRAIFLKFLNIYSRKYLIDISTLEEQYMLYDIPF